MRKVFPTEAPRRRPTALREAEQAAIAIAITSLPPNALRDVLLESAGRQRRGAGSSSRRSFSSRRLGNPRVYGVGSDPVSEEHRAVRYRLVAPFR